MLIIRKPNGFTYYIFDILRQVFYMGGTSKGGYFSQCYTVLAFCDLVDFCTCFLTCFRLL